MIPNTKKRSLSIRKGRLTDLASLKVVADANRDALGFLPRPKLEEAVKAERILVATIGRTIVGFVVFRHRKRDHQTTLSDICVSSAWRRCGVGKALVDALKKECICRKRHFIRLKCPVDLAANEFYRHIGFTHVNVEKGRSRELNIWQFDFFVLEAS